MQVFSQVKWEVSHKAISGFPSSHRGDTLESHFCKMEEDKTCAENWPFKVTVLSNFF